MKRSAEGVARSSEDLRLLYAPIANELSEVECLLQREFSSDDPFVDQLARHGFRLGGKRLRPALLLLSGQVCGAVTHEQIVLAVVMEMVHMATLLHDDVLDEAALRRHTQTVNARWNNEASILLGDYLLARAITKVGTLDSPFACQTIGEAARVVCEGELRQVHWRGKFDLTEHDYLEIIADKTAALTACCCHLGAHYGGGEPAVCEQLTRFGKYLGIAFQIADDLLDVVGDEAATGKSLGTDLIKQKPTLPLIRLLMQVAGKQREEVLEILGRSENHRRDALSPWFRRYDTVGYALETARTYTQKAIDELQGLPAGDARDTLQAIAEFVVTRQE